MNDSLPSILLTVDVEDWFQVENLKPWIPFDSWPTRELRVEDNVKRLLDLLDRYNAKATFFILGWIAERLPHLVRGIAERGHEVASHGLSHDLLDRLSPERLRHDLERSRILLEGITQTRVIGYRAPSFSIDGWRIQAIQAAGYAYDASYNSFAMHGRYGTVDFSPYSKRGIAIHLGGGFYELPVSNLKINGRTLPWGGGAYFRLIPFFLFKRGVQSILAQDRVYMIYLHPWEIDPGQPKMHAATRSVKFKHYRNLDRTQSKLTALMKTFGSQSRFLTCRSYLEDEVFS